MLAPEPARSHALSVSMRSRFSQPRSLCARVKPYFYDKKGREKTEREDDRAAEIAVRRDEPLPDCKLEMLIDVFVLCSFFFHLHFLTFPSERVTKIVESSGHIWIKLYHRAQLFLRARLHGGRGPQVGEVTRLGEVKNNPPLRAILQPRHPGVHFLKIIEWKLST